MNKQQAIDKLKKDKTLTTTMLKPLGIGFDSFLIFSSGHITDKERKMIIDKLIKHYDNE